MLAQYTSMTELFVTTIVKVVCASGTTQDATNPLPDMASQEHAKHTMPAAVKAH